jgi:AraC-like DNA-binding protein
MSVFAPSLSYYWKSAEEIGMDPVELFRKAGIDPRVREDITARVSEKQFDDLVWLAKQESEDDSFAFHIVRNIHPSYLGALGYAWMTSDTLLNAFNRLTRYYRLLTGSVQISVEECDGELRVTFESLSEKYRDPALRERLRVAGAVQMCRMICGESFSPTCISLQQQSPANVQDYYEYFRCRQEFSQKSTRLFISSEDAHKKLPGFNAQILQQFDQMAVEYLARLDHSDILDQVRAAILEQLPSGEATLETIADSLHQTPRTLSRKLADREESFSTLLAGIRRELAQQYILDRNLTLTEISFLLGFSEVSSFSRAYKSWSGASPSAHRNALFAEE